VKLSHRENLLKKSVTHTDPLSDARMGRLRRLKIPRDSGALIRQMLLVGLCEDVAA